MRPRNTQLSSSSSLPFSLSLTLIIFSLILPLVSLQSSPYTSNQITLRNTKVNEESNEKNTTINKKINEKNTAINNENNENFGKPAKNSLVEKVNRENGGPEENDNINEDINDKVNPIINEKNDTINDEKINEDIEKSAQNPFLQEFHSDSWLLNYTKCTSNKTQEKEDDMELWDVDKNTIIDFKVGGNILLADPEQLRFRAFVVYKSRQTELFILGDTEIDWEKKDEGETEGEEVSKIGAKTSNQNSKIREKRDRPTKNPSPYSSKKGRKTKNPKIGESRRRKRRDTRKEKTEENKYEEKLKKKDNNDGIMKKMDKDIEKEDSTEVTVEEGTRLRLVCNVTGVTHYWVEWRRAGNLTFPDGSVLVGGRSVLLEVVGREDGGRYSCTARTSRGTTHSTNLTITVQYAPVVGVWVREIANMGVEVGCLAEGRPHPALSWYKNNTRLHTIQCGGNVEIRSTTLGPGFELSVARISNVSDRNFHEYFAFYHCRATNPLGMSRGYVMLHDGSGKMSVDYIKKKPEEIIYSTPVENPRLASFLLGMVPPLYIALYIIAYLGCYKTPQGGGGRFGANLEMEAE